MSNFKVGDQFWIRGVVINDGINDFDGFKQIETINGHVETWITEEALTEFQNNGDLKTANEVVEKSNIPKFIVEFIDSANYGNKDYKITISDIFKQLSIPQLASDEVYDWFYDSENEIAHQFAATMYITYGSNSVNIVD